MFMENQAVVETVLFLRSRIPALLRPFLRMLLVDRLPALQGALELLVVLLVDDLGRTRPAACCVARPGTPSLLSLVLQSTPDVKGHVRCLTAGARGDSAAPLRAPAAARCACADMPSAGPRDAL